ncbi:hypothetical protein KsCSTR_29900 [Candidatus Kuenenia stuttgartiensis]|uniref:Uncharacterized protein n=1 Tax=Kuenenia stuttgartiensis TaxID=174633 RepID=Q1Q5L8_KUEST|nr:hypothetical protein KsCSTR_29900 [Candidatus Kuenenia stuttgartiensis]CAJ75299.1 unknown protein [Candidatus Kuenenia stuttgartiensis]
MDSEESHQHPHKIPSGNLRQVRMTSLHTINNHQKHLPQFREGNAVLISFPFFYSCLKFLNR